MDIEIDSLWPESEYSNLTIMQTGWCFFVTPLLCRINSFLVQNIAE